MGLTISAEEIIKDRKILKREAFLNLSWFSYLTSKLSVLIMISAIQALQFVLVGNSIMEIKGMYLEYWIILFSCWVSANVMGLVISDSFKTVVTIYILIPFLVIPQIILSGVIVKYEKLNPTISSPNNIPFYGEIITARWGYEALAVFQFKENEFMKSFYDVNKIMSSAKYMKDYWFEEMETRLDVVAKYKDDKTKKKTVESYIKILKNEISKQLSLNPNYKYPFLSRLSLENIDKEAMDSARSFIWQIRQENIDLWNSENAEKDKLIESYNKEKYRKLKREHHNERLSEFVRNNQDENRIVEYNERFIQKIDPIYLDPEADLLTAHFYAPRKKLFNHYYDTFWINTLVIWLMSFLLFLILYFRGLRRLMEAADNLRRKFIRTDDTE
jgi:hypothetical protein